MVANAVPNPLQTPFVFAEYTVLSTFNHEQLFRTMWSADDGDSDGVGVAVGMESLSPSVLFEESLPKYTQYQVRDIEGEALSYCLYSSWYTQNRNFQNLHAHSFRLCLWERFLIHSHQHRARRHADTYFDAYILDLWPCEITRQIEGVAVVESLFKKFHLFL